MLQQCTNKSVNAVWVNVINLKRAAVKSLNICKASFKHWETCSRSWFNSLLDKVIYRGYTSWSNFFSGVIFPLQFKSYFFLFWGCNLAGVEVEYTFYFLREVKTMLLICVLPYLTLYIITIVLNVQKWSREPGNIWK